MEGLFSVRIANQTYLCMLKAALRCVFRAETRLLRKFVGNGNKKKQRTILSKIAMSSEAPPVVSRILKDPEASNRTRKELSNCCFC